MPKYMSQIPPEPKPKARPTKRKPKAVAPKPAKRNPNAGPRVMIKPFKRDENQAGPKVMIKPYKGPKIDKDLRNKREMPKRIPKEIAKGTMGSTYDQARARQQQLLADMRKRMMLRKDKKSN